MDLPYSERPEWSDVVPIPQDDGPNPLVPIAYSSDYIDAMNYFRAVSRNNEKSERVLGLISDIIEMNPAHYTVWRYRQQVLFELNADLQKELNFVDEIAGGQAKNYQVWHHRLVIVDKLNNGDRELPFLNGILDDDSKNYHAWSYRQWVVKRFNLWDQDLKYTDDMLLLDVRNNSAWNYRYYVLFSNPNKPTKETIQQEIEFTKNKIHLAPNNPCGWSYLKAILEKANQPLYTIETFFQDLISNHIISPHLYSTLIDMHLQKAKLEHTNVDTIALTYCDQLATEYDPIRKKYWLYKKSTLSTA
ncbi:uncharacterized protein BX664DRAFT_382600 [Halteromyces radiatus]|uniref:uncharacterized protein n=1 Tax=Halteromyces radiatus TaxID=101107 RepID=UPI0022200E09|nr:uncharacterized protein BX664DRAFT_382600 [Halteromyces radiatus]KAI8100171.1 hypothetical protein BX664DRAFT_382600 [Halteromyces radiatus]